MSFTAHTPILSSPIHTLTLCLYSFLHINPILNSDPYGSRAIIPVVSGRPRFPRRLALQFAMDEGDEDKDEEDNGSYDNNEERDREEEEEQEDEKVGVGLDVMRSRCDHRVTCRALVPHPTKYNRDLFLRKVGIIYAPGPSQAPFSRFSPYINTHTHTLYFQSHKTPTEPCCGSTTPAPFNGDLAARHAEANFPFPARSFFVGVRNCLQALEGLGKQG